jgi:hypothetical protein
VIPDANARRNWHGLHGVEVKPGSVVIGLCGEVWRVLPDGGVEEVSRGLPSRGVVADLRAPRRAP